MVSHTDGGTAVREEGSGVTTEGRGPSGAGVTLSERVADALLLHFPSRMGGGRDDFGLNTTAGARRDPLVEVPSSSGASK